MIILDYFLSVCASITNSMVLYVLTKIKTTKKCVIILFGNMAISHFGLIVGHTIKTVCLSLGVTNHSGCVALMVVMETSSLTYMTTVALLYLELYLSTKQMRVKKSVISTKVTIILITAAWFLIAMSGVNLLNPLTAHEPVGYQFCNVGVYVFHPIHTSLYLGSMTINTVILVVLHAMCYHVIKKSYDRQQAQTVQLGSDGMIPIASNIEWIKRQKAQLNLLLAIMVIVAVGWGSFILIHVMAAFCPPCRPYLNAGVMVIGRLLFSLPMFSNGVVYFTKSPAFKAAVKDMKCTCCRCTKPSEVHPA